jgi:putative endonuclease
MEEYFVYILLSRRDLGLYVGCTTDITKRLRAHDSGFVSSTKNRRPLVIIHVERFVNKADVFSRERFLKSLWSGRLKRKIKERYLAKMKEGL